MSKRLQIVLPHPAAAQLAELAASSDQPAATLAGLMVRNELSLAAKHARVRPVRPAQMPVGHGRVERACWLEPYGGSPAWRAEMWGAIVALHGRYPRALGQLKEGWWSDESRTETLCALAVWRAEIDADGQDPREELAFQTQLEDYARAVRNDGGGVSGAWEPGAPPAHWRSH